MDDVTAFGRDAAMLVGQPMKILVAYSTAIIQCQCEAKSVLPLHGLNKVTICPACKKAFAIAESGMISVGVVTNAPGVPA
jgi:hypothetical protein